MIWVMTAGPRLQPRRSSSPRAAISGSSASAISVIPPVTPVLPVVRVTGEAEDEHGPAADQQGHPLQRGQRRRGGQPPGTGLGVGGVRSGGLLRTHPVKGSPRPFTRPHVLIVTTPIFPLIRTSVWAGYHPVGTLQPMRALLVVNPAATTTSARTRDVLIHALASEMKLEAVTTEYRGHARDLGRQAAEGKDDIELVVALGGDGTVNEVVNGLLHHGPDPDRLPRLAVVPGGSTNVFARALGLPNDAVEATGVLLDALRESRERTVGLGMASGTPGTEDEAVPVPLVHLLRRTRIRRGCDRPGRATAGTRTEIHARPLPSSGISPVPGRAPPQTRHDHSGTGRRRIRCPIWCCP